MINLNLKEVYVNALLADAVYVDSLLKINSVDEQDGLIQRMTKSQAKFIVDNFEVIASLETNDINGSGFDAVVWRGKPGSFYAGRIFVSTRGTEGIQDFLTDTDLAVNSAARKQIANMFNWWKQITTPIGKMAEQIQVFNHIDRPYTGYSRVLETAKAVSGLGLIDIYPNGEKLFVTVNGHSLGGHLASSFARLFGNEVNIESVNTFNSAGFISSSESFFSKIEEILTLPKTKFYQEQNNYFALHGINLTTNDWWFNQVGKRQPLFNEESMFFRHENHYMYKITDALALGYTLSLLDKNLTLASRSLHKVSVSSDRMRAKCTHTGVWIWHCKIV